MRNRPVSGVLYAEDFDRPAAGPAPVDAPSPMEPVAVEPTFSLTDLQRASERARQEERALARAQAEDQARSQRSTALLCLAEAMAKLAEDATTVTTQAAEITAETILAMVAALLPNVCVPHGRAETAALLRLLLPAMSDEKRIVVRAHPGQIGGLRDDVASTLDVGLMDIDWVGTDAMLPGDITVRWESGLMVRDTAALCRDICALILPVTPSSSEPLETSNAHGD